MIRQFLEFSRFNFWRVFVIWNYSAIAAVAAAARPSGGIACSPNARVTHSRTMGEKWTRIPSQLFLTIYSVFSIAWI